MSSILTTTMNPALDIVTEVERIEPWRKLGCVAPSYFAGGGVDVSQTIRRLDGESAAFLVASGPPARCHAALYSRFTAEPEREAGSSRARIEKRATGCGYGRS